MKGILKILLLMVTVTVMVGCASTMVDMSHQDRGFVHNPATPQLTFVIEDKVLEGKGPLDLFNTIKFTVDAYAESARAIMDVYSEKDVAIYPANEAPANIVGRVINIIPLEYWCTKPGILEPLHLGQYKCVYSANFNGKELEGDSYVGGGLTFTEEDLKKLTPKAFRDWATKVKAITNSPK